MSIEEVKEESDEEDGEQLEFQNKGPGSSYLFQSTISRSNMPNTMTMGNSEGKQNMMTFN